MNFCNDDFTIVFHISPKLGKSDFVNLTQTYGDFKVTV